MGVEKDVEELRSQLSQRQTQLQDRIDAVSAQVNRMYARMAADKSDAARELEAWSNERDAPRELREVRTRVRRGEFTWQQVVDRDIDDPQVRAVFRMDAELVTYTRKVSQRAMELMDSDGMKRPDAVERAARELDA